MANSRSPHPLGRDPFQPPTLTPGPLGHNDAASPDSPRTWVGDTPGPLGINDHAQPAFRSENRAQVTPKIDENSAVEILVEDPRVKALLDVIAHAEGATYETMVKGKGSVRITDFSKHPNTVVTVSKALKSTAAGRYQFLYSTWVGLNMPDFSPTSQDKAAVKLLKRRKMIKPLLEGKVEQAIRNGNREWASLPDSPYGQPTHSMKELLKVYENSVAIFKRRNK